MINSTETDEPKDDPKITWTVVVEFWNKFSDRRRFSLS